jgi:polar amino acid transport system substrate-binding protein
MAFRSTFLFALIAFSWLPARAIECPALTRVGISDLGYASFQDGKQYKGISVDIIAELGQRTGCKFELVWYPRGRLGVEFELGHVDIMTGAVQSPERDKNGRFVPYAFTQFDLLLSTRVAGTFTGLADFVQRGTGRLNLVRGIPASPAMTVQFDLLTRAGRLEQVADFDIAFKKIEARRADGTIATPTIYLRQLALMGKAANTLTPVALPESPRQFVGLYLSSKSISLQVANTYRTALRAMVEDGTVVRIYERFIEPPTVKRLFREGVRDVVDAIRTE